MRFAATDAKHASIACEFAHSLANKTVNPDRQFGMPKRTLTT